MTARKKAEPKPSETECEHLNQVWNNGVTYCADCGEHLS